MICLYKTLLLSLSLVILNNTTVLGQESNEKVVEVTKVKKEDIYQTIRLIGTIKAKKSATLIAKISGTIATILPSGTKVSKGTIIAKLENTHLEKSVALSQEAAKISEKQYHRAKTLAESGFISKKGVEEQKHHLVENQQKLTETSIKLDESRFIAPFDGVVGPHKIREGSLVKQEDEILTFYDPSDIIIEFDIPAQYLPHLNKKQKVKIDDKVFELDAVQKIVDTDTHMASAVIDIPDDTHFIGEPIFVDLFIEEHKDVLVVPSEAVFLKNNSEYVYVVENNELSLESVTLGIREKEKIEITEGLKEGDMVVVRGQDRLYPGLAVKYKLI